MFIIRNSLAIVDIIKH
jgi:hypothetical protein